MPHTALLVIAASVLVAGCAAAPAATVARPRRLLLTGFEPFGGAKVNPSWEGIKELDGQRIGGAEVKCVLLPVLYGDGPARLREAVDAWRPDAIVCFGLGGGKEICLERVAKNRFDPKAKDNAGKSRKGRIDPNAPKELSTGLPIERIAERLKREEIPFRFSEDAGGYLCNRIFWEARYYASVPSGFVHVPPLLAIDLPTLKRAVRAIAETVAAEGVPVASAQFAPRHGGVAENVATMEGLARDAARRGARLVVFPEMATTGLAWNSPDEIAPLAEPADGPTARRFGALARELGLWICYGYAEKSGRLYNSAALLGPEGERFNYRKRRLFGHDLNWAAAGEGGGPFETALGRIAIAICHDAVYADIAKECSAADLVLFPTNWIGDEGPEEFLAAFRPPVVAADRMGEEGGVRFSGRGGVFVAGVASPAGGDGLTVGVWRRPR